MKKCSKCGGVKPLIEFYCDRGRPRARCKACVADYDKNRHRNNPNLRRKMNLSYQYKLTPEDYEDLLCECDAKCMICGCSAKEHKARTGRFLVVDHDHMTGKIRGLLCATCNRGIGLLQDNPSLLTKAATYLIERGN